MDEKNLFLVEFGEGIQQPGAMSWSGPSVKPIYVVATDYNKAAQKAQYYLEAKIEEAVVEKSVLTDDGSLNTKDNKMPELKIVAVKHISEVLW